MFFPIGDDNPRRSAPVVTLVLIGINAAIFLAQLGQSEGEHLETSFRHGYDAAHPLSLGALTYQFLHGGFAHVLGNMWVLWIVGDNVEDKLGKAKYLAFYLLGGVLAAWAYSGIAVLSGPVAEIRERFGRDHPPLVGASGSVYAVMGAYLALFPHARIRVLAWFFLFVQVIRIPALFFIGFKILIDVLQTAAAGGPAAGGVATAAHVGGGAFGILVGFALKRHLGGGHEGDAWDVHTGFSRSVRGDTEPARRGPPAVGEPWFAPPEPMEDEGDEVADALTRLVRAGRLREAIDVYPAYVARRREAPLPADVQLEVAHEFYRQGLARDGISAYRKFLDAYPDDADAAEAAFRIGVLYARGLNDARSAVPWLEKAAASHANPQVAQYAAAELARLRG